MTDGREQNLKMCFSEKKYVILDCLNKAVVKLAFEDDQSSWRL
jgi:hypothetical protein